MCDIEGFLGSVLPAAVEERSNLMVIPVLRKCSGERRVAVLKMCCLASWGTGLERRSWGGWKLACRRTLEV